MPFTKEEASRIHYQIQLTTPDGKPYEIQPEGSLGLLALGYKGLLAWRQKRDLIARQINTPINKEGAN